jgi:hypothetical protein
MRSMVLVLLSGMAAVSYGQQPNVAAQREAMKKLEFLVGKWSGQGTVVRGPGEPMKLRQSEDVQFKLDGLVMTVEGTGRNAAGQVVFRAFATIAYDDSTSAYRFRAYNDGRYLDTELKVTPDGFAWGYTAGQLKVSNTMRLTAKGEWSETTETQFGETPPRKSVEMTLRREQ